MTFAFCKATNVVHVLTNISGETINGISISHPKRGVISYAIRAGGDPMKIDLMGRAFELENGKSVEIHVSPTVASGAKASPITVVHSGGTADNFIIP